MKYGESTKFASPTGQMYDTHKLLGMLILLVVIARFAYRMMNGAPGDEPTLEPWQRIVSHITHWAIYALLFIVPILGWLAVSAYGPFAPFGIKLPRLIAENQDLATRLFGVHKIAAIAADRCCSACTSAPRCSTTHPQGRRAEPHVDLAATTGRKVGCKSAIARMAPIHGSIHASAAHYATLMRPTSRLKHADRGNACTSCPSRTGIWHCGRPGPRSPGPSDRSRPCVRACTGARRSAGP